MVISSMNLERLSTPAASLGRGDLFTVDNLLCSPVPLDGGRVAGCPVRLHGNFTMLQIVVHQAAAVRAAGVAMPAHHGLRPRVARALLIPLILSLFVAGACVSSSGASDRAQVAESPTPTPVTIRWSFWGDPWEAAINRRIVRAFEAEHPAIRVEMVHKPWSEYFTWLQREWSAGRSPDVMFLNYLPTYVPSGELEPLDAFVERDALNLDDFYPALLDAFRVDGTLYGLPRDNDTKVIYYNRAHFQEAGLPEPRAGWTWDDLRAAARTLSRTDANGIRYGFGFEPDYWWMIWVWQGGGEVVDDPRYPTRVLVDSPESVQSLQFLCDLIHLDDVTPPAAQLNTDDLNHLFREGRVSMIFGNHAHVPWFTEAAGLSWDVAPLPQNARRVNVAGGAGFTVSRRSQNKDAAWQLVKFLTSPKAQAILAESGVITPARRSVREDNIFMRQQRYRADVFVTETEIGRTNPNFRGATEMERIASANLTRLWRGEKPADAVARDMAGELRQALGLAGP